MTEIELVLYKDWFRSYSLSFITTNPDEQKSIILKQIHTEKVCQNIAEIAQSLLMKEDEVILAESIALFHDIGRFPQLQKYKTFRDSISINHGVLGAETLKELHILEKLPQDEQSIILNAVKYHNAFKMPHLENEKETIFLKLIRDADKLDIWRIFIEHYENIEDISSPATLGLLDTEGYSDSLTGSIFRGDIIPLSKVHNLNDYKLLQLSWIFDLNYKASFKLFRDRDYLNRLLAKLPESVEIIQAGSFINDFINKKFKMGEDLK